MLRYSSYVWGVYSLFQTFRQSTFCDSFYVVFGNNYLVFFTWRNVNLFNKKVNVNGIL